MKDKLLSRISNIVALVLLAVSVVIVLAMYVGPNADTITNAGGDVMNVPAATDTLIYWCYALLGFARKAAHHRVRRHGKRRFLGTVHRHGHLRLLHVVRIGVPRHYREPPVHEIQIIRQGI